MQQIVFSDQTHWQFELFQKQNCIKHFVTGSNTHIKRGDIPGLNYGLNVPDQQKVVVQNRNELLEHLNLKDAVIIFPVQTHTSNIEVITKQNIHQAFIHVDALITNVPNIAIGVLSADCVPILLLDPIQKVIASIHAGWRGTVAEIVKDTIAKMCTEFNSKSENIIAGIGPSISHIKFEVGEEVAIQFREACKTSIGNAKFNIDLLLENKLQLIEAGINENNIEISGMCTHSNSTDFYSARRDGIDTGRLASVIALLA